MVTPYTNQVQTVTKLVNLSVKTLLCDRFPFQTFFPEFHLTLASNNNGRSLMSGFCLTCLKVFHVNLHLSAPVWYHSFQFCLSPTSCIPDNSGTFSCQNTTIWRYSLYFPTFIMSWVSPINGFLLFMLTQKKILFPFKNSCSQDKQVNRKMLFVSMITPYNLGRVTYT